MSYDLKGFPGAGQCGLQGSPAHDQNSPAGACGTDMYTGSSGLPPGPQYSNMDLEYDPPPITGQCTSTGTPQPNSITYGAQDLACQPNSQQSAGCNGNECTPGIPAPFQVCIVSGGNQNCPPSSPFTKQHIVGTSVTYACKDCGCNVTGDCSGTMNLYTDSTCGGTAIAVPADGKCHDPMAPGGTTIGSYKYVANVPAVQCAPNGSSSAQNISLASEQTVCCVP